MGKERFVINNVQHPVSEVRRRECRQACGKKTGNATASYVECERKSRTIFDVDAVGLEPTTFAL